MTDIRTVNMPLRAGLLVLAIIIGEVMRAGIASSGAFTVAAFAKGMGATLLYAMLHAWVLGWMAARSDWPVWQLFGAMFLALFGIQGVLPFVEVVYFQNALPFKSSDVDFMVFAAVPSSGIAAASAVLLFGNLFAEPRVSSGGARGGVWSWVWRLAVVGLVYGLLYFLAGAFIVQVQDYARDYYKHLAGNIDPLWLFLFQIGRGIVWVLFALPLLASQTTSTWERSAVLGVAFVVFVGALLFGENPYMPGQLRMLHLIEIATSNFFFGLAAEHLTSRLVRS